MLYPFLHSVKGRKKTNLRNSLGIDLPNQFTSPKNVKFIFSFQKETAASLPRAAASALQLILSNRVENRLLVRLCGLDKRIHVALVYK